jgi:hypothetical protein
MKLKGLTLAIFFHVTFSLHGQDKYMVDWEYKDQSFSQFVSNAEDVFKIKFFYKEEWVAGLKMGDYQGVNTLTGVLDNILNGKSIYYLIDESGNIVFTKDYILKVSDGPVDQGDKFIPSTVYSSDNENLNKSGNVFIEVGNPADRNRPGTVVVSGYITNKDTKEPIAGATIFVSKLAIGTISNGYGYYSLTLPRGIHLVQFSFIGLKEKMINLNLNSAGEMNVEMNSMLIPLKEAVVSAEKNVTLQRFEVGAEKINIATFRLLPTTLGESDIIKSILLIPGVQSSGEGSAGFNVRGGAADQNLILLYGAPIYNSSHFFGFFSAINSDIIKDVTLYKGGIPGRYGGRISSVLDIVSKEGNRKEFAGNAGISPITTHVSVEGPIIKDTLTYIFTGRTTYSNWLTRLMENPALQNSSASFYDLNGKITYDINKKNKIDLSAYLSHDAFMFNSDTVYSYDNNIIALKWRHFYTNTFFSNISLNNSFYKYNISSQEPVTEAFDLSHKVNSTGFKADFNWFMGKNEINFGLDLTDYSISPGSFMPANDSSLIIPHEIDRERALEGALYAEDKFTLTSYMSLNVGMRMSAFYAYGNQNFVTYDPDLPRSRSSITDTISFKYGDISSKYAGPEFRVSLNFRISDRNSFKINYNRTRQYIHLLSNSTSISPTDTWKLSDYYIKPEVGGQIALGFYRMLSRSGFEASAELYYKEIKNMVDYKGGTKLIMAENIERDIINVEGKAYGMELILKKTEGKVRYSVGYTYSKTLLRSTGKFEEEILNSGNWYPASFDKPHDLVLIFNYLYSRRFSFSSSYVYSTGRPITYPVATYRISNKLIVHYSERNEYRIPYYSRLDLSVRVSGNLKSKKIAHPNWTFSIYNVLGRENVYSVYFKNENEVLKGYKLSVFGRAIPSVTFSFDF